MTKEEIEMVKREASPQGSQPVSSRSRERSRNRRENTVGILRLDPVPRRRSSGSSVEFRTPSQLSAQGCAEPVSPQPSVDRLSVTFASESPCVIPMDKVRFQSETVPSEEEDEEYSQSVSAIFQRKASTRRSRKRRSSSPKFPPEDDGLGARLPNRRRSSVFTTSSGDTAIPVEDPVQEQILQNIKLHKEVLSSVKQQPWNMRRKLRLVRQAKAYIRRHEGELQERLAQSRSTRDILARFNIVIIRHWQHTKRELANLMNVLIPWEIRIKEIESHFGSVVASYFTFLRWLFWVNLVTAVVLIVFVAVPEMVMSNPEKSGMRKKMMKQEEANATNLFTLWDFDGILKYSPLFYGYYSHRDPEDNSLAKKINYSMPLAYFITELVVYIYSFVAILRRMAENSRQSKLSEKEDECVFTWKLFTGWDYMIGNSETAHNRTASIILGFKEALLEEAEKKRDEGRNWKVTSLRVFAHMNVIWLLGSSVYAVILVVQRSTEAEEQQGWWRKNETTIVVSLITSLFPVFFEVFGIIEQYHPRKKLRMQLARIMALNLLNIYTLIFASFSKINEMSQTLEKMRENVSSRALEESHEDGPFPDYDYLTRVSPYWDPENLTSSMEFADPCRKVPVSCTSPGIGVTTPLLYAMSVFTTTFATTQSIDGQHPLTSSISSLSSDFSSPYPPTFNSPSIPDSSLGVNGSISFDAENVTSSNVVDEDYNFDVDEYFFNNNSSFNLSNFGEYVYEMDEKNGTKYNNSDINENVTDFTTSVNVSLNQNLTEMEYDSENYTETDTSTTSSTEIKTSSLDDTAQSSTMASSDSEEKMCFIVECPTRPSPSPKPTVPIPETSKKYTTPTTTLPTTTLSGFSQRESKRLSEQRRKDLTGYISSLDMETRKKLVPLCWETMFGREMVKLTVMDLVMTVISTLMVDFFRAIFVRFMNNCWCWDLEKKFPQYGDFKIAENILHLVNNQGMVWMGMFFSPGLPLINVIKLAIMMYLRSWAVLTCNVPHEVVFRASRSNNFYMALLLTMLFLCVLPVGYAVVWVTPSWHCGPFSTYKRIYYIFTSSLKKALPYDWLHKAFDYIASPSIIIPLLMLLILIIYYLISLTSALREANNDLKIQLRRERTEERRKMFRLVDKKRQEAENPSLKWKKAMPNFGKLSISDIPIDLLKVGAANGNVNYESAQKGLIEEFMKKAKRMPSGTSEEENMLVDGGDGTDAEQHDSLPYDAAKQPRFADLIKKKDGIDKKLSREDESKKRNEKKKCQDKSSSKDGEGSENSGWSEIPEIRIIQTESVERLDDVDSQSHIEIKSSKSKDNKSKSGSSQQKVRKRHEKTTKNRQSSKDKVEKKKDLQNEIDNVDGKKSKTNHKAKKRNSNKTQEESNKTDRNENNDNGSSADKKDCSKEELESKSGDSEKRYKLKTIISASQVMRNKEKNVKKQNTSNSDEDDVVKVHKKSIKQSDKDTQKPSKSKAKERSKHQEEDDVYESPEESGEDSNENNFQSDSDSPENTEHSVDENSVSDSESKSENNEEHILNESASNEARKTKKHLKKQSNSTETEGSDVSSQNTVKQVEFSERRIEGKTDSESEKDGDDAKAVSSRENKRTKKAIARFKIANVLLKEARRRSSSGLDEK